jgi:predicted RNA binding protein YcfA (HicA-like mRNA interferase family)
MNERIANFNEAAAKSGLFHLTDDKMLWQVEQRPHRRRSKKQEKRRSDASSAPERHTVGRAIIMRAILICKQEIHNGDARKLAAKFNNCQRDGTLRHSVTTSSAVFGTISGMNTKSKRLKKMANQPTGASYEDCVSVLTAKGFRFRDQTGSHCQFKNDKTGVVFTLPRHPGTIKPFYVKQILKLPDSEE